MSDDDGEQSHSVALILARCRLTISEAAVVAAAPLQVTTPCASSVFDPVVLLLL